MSGSLLPGLLAALAVAALLPGPTAAARLRSLAPRAGDPPRDGVDPRTLKAVSALAGGVLALLIGGVPGIVLGVAVTLAGPNLLERLDDTEDDDEAVAAQLPLALDLLGACLAGGSTLNDAVAAVAAAVPGPLGDRLLRLHASLAVGSSPAEAFRVLGTDQGPAGSVARALSRSADGGAPVALAVSRVATDARTAAATEATSRARRAGVTATAPLGACFLPAFVLIGVVPTVIGMAEPLRGFL